MVKPSKVLGFLNFAGPLGWDPSLAFVMGGGVLVALPLFHVNDRGVNDRGVNERELPSSSAGSARPMSRPW